jgi:hypothetical protein
MNIYFLCLSDEYEVIFFKNLMESLFENVSVVNKYEDCDICFIGTNGIHNTDSNPFLSLSKEKNNFLLIQESFQWMDTFANKDFYSKDFFSKVHIIGMQDIDLNPISFTRFSYWKYYIDWFNKKNNKLIEIKQIDNNVWKNKEKDNTCSFASSYRKNLFDHVVRVSKKNKELSKNKYSDFYKNNNRYDYVNFIKDNFSNVNEYGLDINLASGQISKLDNISNHSIHLAFENIISPKYVTEKLFHGIVSGSLTLYYGDEYAKTEFNSDKFFIFKDYETLNIEWEKIQTINSSKDRLNSFISQPTFLSEPNINDFIERFYKIINNSL